tara:strand:+ start:595 stop:780 length:186 start_codon:yes stop_codon:yes gene_type:complete
MSKYTDDEIANACMKCVDDWEMDALIRYAYDKMYDFYTELASADTLEDLMESYHEEEIEDE